MFAISQLWNRLRADDGRDFDVLQAGRTQSVDKVQFRCRGDFRFDILEAIARANLDYSYVRHARAVYLPSKFLSYDWQSAFAGQQHAGHACDDVQQPPGQFRDAVCCPCRPLAEMLRPKPGHGGGRRLERETRRKPRYHIPYL